MGGCETEVDASFASAGRALIEAVLVVSADIFSVLDETVAALEEEAAVATDGLLDFSDETEAAALSESTFFGAWPGET